MSTFFRKGVSVFFAVFTAVFLLASAQAQTFNGPGFTISDGGGRVTASCSIVPVSGITGNVLVSSVALSLNHSWIGDTETRVYPPGVTPPATTGSVVLSSPPDDRPCNFAGTYRYIDSAATSIDAATTGCVTTSNVPAGNYRTSTYGGDATTNGPITSITDSFGALSAAQANGNWRVCVFDFFTPDGGTVANTSITLAPLLAAGANVSGRVATPNGRGISGAYMTLTDAGGVTRTAITNPFGYYIFDDVSAGETYFLRVNHKRYEFQNATQIISVNDNVGDINFTSAQD